MRLLPSALDARAVSAFVGFHGGFFGWLIEHGEESNVRDEIAMSFLGGRLWSLPGTDVLEQLAYDGAGGVFTSEEAVDGAGELRLGTVAELRYQDIARLPATAAVIAASHPDNQPLCSQCACRPFCTLAPSLSQKLQGSLWGQTPSSPLCALQMGLLDHILESLNDEKCLLLMNKWHVDIT